MATPVQRPAVVFTLILAGQPEIVGGVKSLVPTIAVAETVQPLSVTVTV